MEHCYNCSLMSPDGTVIPIGTYNKTEVPAAEKKARAYVKSLNLPSVTSVWRGLTYIGIFRWDVFSVEN